MKAEILFNDYFLFGDAANVEYIKKCLPESEFIYTEIHDKPYFVDNEPDLIYMGAMSESNQVRAINALSPYRDRLCELIEKGVHFLFTANACDILGNYIIDNGEKTPCLGLFDFYVERKMLKRFNGMTLGTYNGMDIVGFKSQFGLAYPNENCTEKFFDVTRGTGLNPDCHWEGFKRNNLIATYIIGPFLIINPLFTKRWLSEIEGKEIALPFEETAMQAYTKRLEEFKDENREI